ncbi:ATP-binding protein [Pseudobacteriovorax antillogorgiicola]|uniref:histidine kinase n=1 Tax=Pseudobacteriovorax antillogorgiicola TaxID=1513793 RepID=A0A1Y6BMM2_9BACT|nr:ATP-binding protein [Pseudobacteriovorax antillogorgiicola]TCS53952.1 PAS domain-containing protein [Pseudobacteriovorax antillogorgiicola]SMF20100.1 PAS fold-containing protein [Pseudobacteriovorax antillogorgiicola]
MIEWTITDAVNTSPILIFILDDTGTIVRIAGSLAQQLNIDSSSALGSSAFKISNFPCRRSHFKRAMKGSSFSINTTISNRSYETEFTPAKDASGVISGVVGMTLDVTKSLEVEQFLDEERHKIFASQRLNSLATVTNGIAHEINNPLAIISGYAEQLKQLCKKEPMPIRRIDFVTSKIISASNRCSRIIDSLKDFSRDGSQDEFELSPVGQLIDDTIELCGQKFKSAGVKLKVGMIEDQLEIKCRRVQMIQVLFNLLNNALDACKLLDRPMVSIEVAELQNSVAISITDNGPGIPESIKNKIFEPFFTTKEVGSGVGVGLSIAKGVVEEHQGSLELESQTGNTVFIITLPKAGEEQSSTESAS